MLFPDAVPGPLPDFTASGALPEGDYRPSPEDFEERFVHLPNSSSRVRIYAGWNRLRAALLQAGGEAYRRQLLNGSYTTDKLDPGDLDVAVEVGVSAAEYQELTASGFHPLLQHLKGPDSKPAYGCDAYPILMLPLNHPDFNAVSARAIAYWVKWFGTGRDGRPKGRVWATNGGF